MTLSEAASCTDGVNTNHSARHGRALVPAIRVFDLAVIQDVDARDKRAYDGH
ncbi:MAG: hypothetical protein MZV49_02215 [Rhodopseudomonas palustris]|nr:hypothetical protein [Rhodopseudomonas palustris]